jgi:DNA-binding XRE family transcriptional regulator
VRLVVTIKKNRRAPFSFVSAHKLQNYLRTYRRRAALSQDEVAYLLGCRSGTKVCRYERRSRLPALSTALAYEIIFRTPISELFAGIFQQIERRTVRRVEALARKLSVAKCDRLTNRKLNALGSIVFPRDSAESS